MQHIKRMTGRAVESSFATPAQFIKTDGGKRADQSKTCGDREGERQQRKRIAQGEADQQNSQERIDDAQKYRVAGDRGEIVDPAAQRIINIACGQAANDRLRRVRCRADENMRIGHRRSS
jgi:hypothetical protein